jgi:hypothetical protein
VTPVARRSRKVIGLRVASVAESASRVFSPQTPGQAATRAVGGSTPVGGATDLTSLRPEHYAPRA